MASEKVSRKMVLEIKYFNANNAVIHTENSKLLLDSNCSPKELEKAIVNSCGIEHSAAKRGFSDHSIELYYVDHVEPGNPKKAAFILRTDETFGMLRAIDIIISTEGINVISEDSLAGIDSEWSECDSVCFHTLQPVTDQLEIINGNPNIMCASSSDDLYAFDEGLSGVDSQESVYDTEEFYLDFDFESRQMGGQSTVNMIRGPMWHGMGRGGVFTPETIRPNLAGPSDRTLKKHSSGYAKESGIINPLLRFHDLASKPDSVIIDGQIVKVLSVHEENDGAALKPSLQFDTTQKKVVCLASGNLDINYVKAHKDPSPELTSHLKDNIATEATVTVLTNSPKTSTLAVGVGYHSRTVVVPGAVHLGKTYKCCWGNWFLILGRGDRSTLATLRMLRNDSDHVVSEKLHKLLTAESVRNKDRMAVEPLLELTNQELLDFLKSKGTIFLTMNILPDSRCSWSSECNVQLCGGLDNVSSLALSEDELALCADGVLHVFVPSQRVIRIVRGSDGLPISSQAVNVAWFRKDILFCEEHSVKSVKLFESGAVAVIAGHSKGDSDGSQSLSKLCQSIGICVEFDRNIYVTDSPSGAVKLINRPLTGIAEFLGKLQVLVKAFHIHAKKKTHSYYLAEPSAAGQLVSVEIPKPVGERLSRNEEAEMRLWAKRFGKCVRQRNVRQDNTMERAESETDEHPVEAITYTDQRDDYSSSESGDSESDEDCADDRIGFHMVMSTRAGRERLFTSRMRDFLQSRASQNTTPQRFLILHPLSEKLSVVFLKVGVHTINSKIIDSILIAGPSNSLKGAFDVKPVGTEEEVHLGQKQGESDPRYSSEEAPPVGRCQGPLRKQNIGKQDTARATWRTLEANLHNPHIALTGISNK
ncbi:hypothetical protein AWC38_SpisGene14752 [Stylophora pistillata]|uniref:Uncharacterized protein n=1 Tax=Stylophora pistillata TaxID=50429 RepID=A0A2B4RW38_STYPI|nr:hypothetical protein AWC38_SpisGene14752 [Stylophora pistillata]